MAEKGPNALKNGIHYFRIGIMVHIKLPFALISLKAMEKS